MDRDVVAAWLGARSVARGLPAPVLDHGGLRVDTWSEKEHQRWVFAQPDAGIAVLGRALAAPRLFIKLCAPSEELRSLLPSRWEVKASGYFMAATRDDPPLDLAPGYRVESEHHGAVTHVRIMTGAEVAASGHAAETADAFVYDRIETAAEHRRRGLGRALMIALGQARRSPTVPRLLVATELGSKLYASLGWTARSVYSTGLIPG